MKMSDYHRSVSEDEEDDEDIDDDELIEGLPELEDYLSKWTNYLHGWQDRWVVLRDGTLSYFKARNDMASGCRGSISLARADIEAHQFDDKRLDITVNENVWYLRTRTSDERQRWIDALEAQKSSAEDSDTSSLRRHGSLLSLRSGSSSASASSFRKGRGLWEKLAEMETFRDILCRQVDTLQGFFDTCAEQNEDPLKWSDEGSEDDLEIERNLEGTTPTPETEPFLINGPSSHRKNSSSDKSPLDLHNMGIDFRGEALTFKATTAGILTNLSHCIDLIKQREEQWKKRLDREQEKRRKAVEAYKNIVKEMKKKAYEGGPDFQEGPHSLLNEDQFFDAIETALDINDSQEEEWDRQKETGSLHTPNYISADHPPSEHRLSKQCQEKIDENVKYAFTNIEKEWDLVHQEGELKVYKSEQEVDGIIVDPLKAIHTVKGVSAYEMCFTFWDVKVRMEWDLVLDSSVTLEIVSPDTVISHQVMRRVWPSVQRDTCFASHIRKLDLSSRGASSLNSWITSNFSVDHPKANVGKCIRAKLNVSMLCETFLDPPDINPEEATRDNLVCKVYYISHVNPGGWAPASVLRTVYKREYPKFLRRFSSYVQDRYKKEPVNLH
ncbi:Collagen type IV alpha-3-binding protein [Holothuria leucospilota]|uniref:Collagen type IV alpha-3-binding protein n=1 Tax=Holothuria leucospilota TaxID=206669 RepID=A0A9Q1H2M0_HOLLE|nr:Collagen type IV alpha-3-binding protein [Holothuria leucospilota]